jgi:hypothetical protein
MKMRLIKWLKAIYKNLDKRLIIVCILLGLVFRCSLLIPQPSAGSDLLAGYDYAMAEMVSGIIGALGDTIVLIAIGMVVFRTVKSHPKYKICGAAIQSADDKFCRACGALIG